MLIDFVKVKDWMNVNLFLILRAFQVIIFISNDLIDLFDLVHVGM